MTMITLPRQVSCGCCTGGCVCWNHGQSEICAYHRVHPHTHVTELFARTTCACPECVACCTRQPGSLAAGDLERIADRLGLSVRVAALKFWASPGALAMNSETGQVFRIGTITPRMERGQCVFLDAESKCSIHEVAPFGCAYFDTHMSAVEAQPRSVWLGRSQMDASYQRWRQTMPAAESYAPLTY